MTAKTAGVSNNEKQPLLQSDNVTYGGLVGQLSKSLNIDSQLLARAIDMAAEQKLKERLQSIPVQPSKVTASGQLSWDGGIYEGASIDGEPHGKGVLTYPPGHKKKSYDGYWQEGQFHGKGVLIYTNGDRVEGDWQFDSLHGWGLKVLASGYREEGNFIAGRLHGKATVRWAEGGSYKGDWVAGFKHGQGTYTNKDGDEYTGEWEKGLRSGQGTQRDRDGTYYEGGWLNDKYDGNGYYSDRLAKRKGVFRNGNLWRGKTMVTGGHVYEYREGVTPEESCCMFALKSRCCDNSGDF